MLNNRARFVADRAPGVMSYQGTWIEGEYHSFFDLINDRRSFAELEPSFKHDLNRIRYIFGCDTIRVVLRPHPTNQTWGGFNFPEPTLDELLFIRNFKSVVKGCGLKFWPVFVLPEGYWWKDPYIYDTFYCHNNRILRYNMEIYVSSFSDVLNGSIRITSLGDYNPFDVYECHTPEEKDNHLLWGSILNHTMLSYNSHNEAIGSVDKPLKWIPKELGEPCVRGVQLYLDWRLKPDIHKIIQKAYEARPDFIIEETGVFPGDEITDDGNFGVEYWKQIYKAKNEICPHVPVGIWAWGSSTKYGWGWSMNRADEIRPCWWHICAGNGGLMWDIKSETVASVKATRRQSNYLLIPVKERYTTIEFRVPWENHVKISFIGIGSDNEITRVLNPYEHWLNDGDRITVDSENQHEFIWLAVDFNWVDPNLGVTVEVT